MKLSNVKDWKTTVVALVGGIIVIAGIVWPDKVSPETGEILKEASTEVIIGIGAIISALSGILGKDK